MDRVRITEAAKKVIDAIRTRDTDYTSPSATDAGKSPWRLFLNGHEVGTVDAHVGPNIVSYRTGGVEVTLIRASIVKAD